MTIKDSEVIVCGKWLAALLMYALMLFFQRAGPGFRV